ncbi:transmembrane protein 74 [Hypomesus transpacificus]|uniref:transmembrane protein 74 n=1 Tax=Hypomesus transpacificus TaxID=137520 RepID=UPI001F07B2B1|nr:transmembrane protein 74 [Hypomesus transpacificus]
MEHACSLASLDSEWTATTQEPGSVDDNNISVNCNKELETYFTCHDEDLYIQPSSPQSSHNGSSSHLSRELHEGVPALYMLSDDELAIDGSGKSVDYGFISAVTCLVTGILLVSISYAIPLDVKVDSDRVSAREMESLERENARVWAGVDKCVIAGLCLLTFGGVMMSTLVMVSMRREEVVRRTAFGYSMLPVKLYGSIALRGGSNQTLAASSQLSVADGDLEVC